MPSTKYEGLSYPIHYFKSRASVITNNSNQVTLFTRRNDFYALFVTNKSKHDTQ